MNNVKLNEFIKYEDLVSKHNSQLIDKLRLHGSEDEVLSLWVPDENITKSFINLVSSLIEAKRESYKISFAEQLFSEIIISEITKYFQNNLSFSENTGDSHRICDCFLIIFLFFGQFVGNFENNENNEHL